MKISQVLSSYDHLANIQGSGQKNLPKDLAIILLLMDQAFSTLPQSKGRKLDRIGLGDTLYFIGAQLANLTRRTTFNLYRAMRTQRVPCVKATALQVRHINLHKLPFVGQAPSITLVPLEQGLVFFRDSLYALRYHSLISYLDFQRTQTGKRPK